MTTPLDPGPWLGQPEPEPEKPEAGQPEYAQPEYAQPEYAQPEYGQPQYGQPEAGQPEFVQPEIAQPEYEQPQYGQPEAGQPEFVQPVIGQPEASPSVPRRRPRRVLFVALIVVGVLLIAGGAGALVREMTRKATPAEASAALQQEIASRWERLPAGKICPATVSYNDPQGTSMVARLVGVAPPASCRTALDPASYALVRNLGCATILRATYVDASGALATTVGVAVLRSSSAAVKAGGIDALQNPGDGLHAVSFDGTIAGQFSDAARGAQGAASHGPYLFLYTAGFTDGLPGSAAAAQEPELTALGSGVDTGLQAVLTAHGKPCNMKDITC